MLFRRPRYRRFDYEPRFYKPESDPSQRLKDKMRVERGKSRRKQKPVIFVGLLFILLFYAYLYLTGYLK